MATKQFISLENLSLYNDLLLQVMAEEDAKAIKAASLEGKRLNLYTQENPTAQDQPRFSITLPFTQQEIVSAEGKAMVWNEASGGGAMFQNVDGTTSFIGVNNEGANGIAAQIYAKNKTTNVGTRINVTTSGIYYTNGKTNGSYDSGDEIATKKDVQGDAASKTVYLQDESAGQSDWAKVYKLYQGSDPSDMTKDTLVGTINIPKDLFVKSASIQTVTTADVPYPGAKVGDKYIDVEIQNQTDHLYIPVNDLVDVYTGGTTAEITVSIDANNVITATINNGSVAKAKLDAGVQASLDLADTALQDEDISSVEDSDIEALFE